jgi:hypothetical protein
MASMAADRYDEDEEDKERTYDRRNWYDVSLKETVGSIER